MLVPHPPDTYDYDKVIWIQALIRQNQIAQLALVR